MKNRSHLMATYAEPTVTFVSGSGTTLIDDQGKEYLDFLCGLAVTSLGHARPEVTSAIADQANTLSHVSNLFANELGPEVADLIDGLLTTATGTSGRVFLCNSGAEANECALKLARRVQPGKHAVITTLDSFHGRTLATLTATGQPAKHEPFQPLPEGFSYVPFGDLTAMKARLAIGDVAAVLVECIQAEGGVNVPEKGYLSGVEAACREAGALFMVDEVQAGLGRTGQWFSFQDEGLTPDVVTMAKALGNGFPVGACWAKADVADCFGPGDHGSTFGGQPLAMAAVKATLATMIDIDAPNAAASASAHLVSSLSDLDGIVAVRGRGLLLGAVLSAPVAGAVAASALKDGLIVNAVRPDVIRLTPPLTVSSEEIDEAVRRLGVILHETMGSTQS
ncbi:MAG: acetylornithine/succinylornithine family transaminase [Actinomycetes bacterium]